jgi:tetratricopeptide (TPR) repeat protein
VLAAYGLNAVQRRDWPEALRRWTEMSNRLPNLRVGLFNSALALREMGRLAEADAMLCTVKQHDPDVFQAAYQWALNPHYQHAWLVAVERWSEIRRDWPDEPAGYSWGVGALRELGRVEEAEALLAEGQSRNPDNLELAMEAALLSGSIGDWTNALKRWDVLHALHPEHPAILSGRTQATLLAGYAQADQSVADPAATTLPRTAAPAPGSLLPAAGRDMSILFKPAALVAMFESLGRDCEFGLLQRHHGAEPLGLLRWGGPDIDYLIKGFQTGFEGLGDPGTIRLENRHSEYFLHDDVYRILMHTFIPVDETKTQKILTQLGRRMAFLRRHLLEEVAAAERIFIFKDNEAVDRSKILTLHDEMLKYGPSTLLVMQEAGIGREAADVEKLRDGLFIGYVSAFGNHPVNGDGSWNIPFQEWLNICRIVYAAC